MRTDKPKLLVTASTFPRWKDDTEPRFILDLCKALTKYFDITILVPSCPNSRDEEVLEGVNVIRYHYFPVHRWETLCYPGAIVPRIKEKWIRACLVPFLFIGLYLKEKKIINSFDMVHAHWLIPQGVVQSFFRKPYVLTGHGGDILELNKFPINILKGRALKKADAVSVVSPKLKDYIDQQYHIDNIYVQSMGCNIDTFSIENKVENYFDQGYKKAILYVGRFVKIKGIEFLIDAMETIDAKLILVGDGPDRERLEQRASKLKDKITFWGARPHSELATIYASSDIFVLPSITLEGGVTEGTPTVIAEAMASGLPIIATNTGGIPDIIENGKNGFIIAEKSSDAIREKIDLLIHNEVLRSSMSQYAYTSSRKFSYETIAINFNKIFKNILD